MSAAGSRRPSSAQGRDRGVERALRLVADRLNDLVLEYDLEGRIVFASAAAPAVIGLAPGQLVGRRTWEFVHPEDRARVVAAYDRIIRAPGELHGLIEFRAISANGGVRHLEVSPRPVLAPRSGRVRSFFDLVRDVSERRALELRLSAAMNDAQAAARTQSTFLASMSHELRTPLTSVIGYAQLIRAEREATAASHEAASRILAAGRSLLAALNDVLDLARIEAGDLVLTPALCAPAKILEELADQFRPAAQVKGLTLDVEGLAALPAAVAVDGERLQQALAKLLDNAVKFTTHGGVALAGRFDPTASRLGVDVSDTGAGIAQEHLAQVFDRFRQIDDSVSRASGGAGVGLAICKGLVAALGGEVSVVSEPGGGSCFSIVVPVEPAGEAPAPERADLAGRAVLVVDDNAENRQIIGALLTAAGLQTTCADSGRQALAMAAVQAFDAVLMDMRMADMSGADAARAIRDGDGPNRYAPILLCTADSAAADSPDTNLFDGTLLKPISPVRLLSSLSAVMDPAPVAALGAQG